MKRVTLVMFILACSILQAQDSTSYKNKIGLGVMPIVKYENYYNYSGFLQYSSNQVVPFFSYRREIMNNNILKGVIGGKYLLNSSEDLSKSSYSSTLFLYDIRLGYEKWLEASKIWSFYVGPEIFLNNYMARNERTFIQQWNNTISTQYDQTNIYYQGAAILIGTSISPIQRLSILIEHNLEYSLYQTRTSSIYEPNNPTYFTNTKGTKIGFNPFKSITVTYNF